MQQLLETIAAELERPREISPQIYRHLEGTYGIDRSGTAAFLKEELPRLEDYEHDLILSPLYTPRLPDQAVIAAILGASSVSREEWPALVWKLAERPIHASLVSMGGQTYSVTLREVSIE